MKKASFFQKILSFFVPIVLEKRNGELGHSLEITLDGGKLLLNTKTANYSYGTSHQVFRRAFYFAKVEEMKPKNVLVLGFGGGSIVKILLKELNLSPKITGIEYDSVVIELWDEYFNGEFAEKVDLIQADAFGFVKKCEAKFDLICVDLFIDTKVPAQFRTLEFAKNLLSCTEKKSTIVFNFIAEKTEEQQALKTLERFFEENECLVSSFNSHQYNQVLLIQK